MRLTSNTFRWSFQDVDDRGCFWEVWGELEAELVDRRIDLVIKVYFLQIKQSKTKCYYDTILDNLKQWYYDTVQDSLKGVRFWFNLYASQRGFESRKGKLESASFLELSLFVW